MKRIIQTAIRYDGTLAALLSDGSLAQQVRDGGGFKWQDIEAPSGRFVHLTVRPDGRLVAVHSDGTIYEQYRTGATLGDYSQSWRPLPTLPS